MIRYGADPEVFAMDGNGNVVPPVIFREILGVKTTPDGRHPIFKETAEFKLHEDGAAFEVGVTASDTMDEVLRKVHDAYASLQELLDKHGYKMGILPSAPFDVVTMNQYPAWIKDCMIFGCDMDFDAWNHNKGSRTEKAMQHPWRYGGGHWHISGLTQFESDPIGSIRTFSGTIGMAAVAYSHLPELDRRRTYSYGLPGKYRPQRYPDGSVGVEYRSTSNAWTDYNSPIFEPLKAAMDLALRLISGNRYEPFIAEIEEVVLPVFKEHRKSDAMSILKLAENYV